MISGWMVPVTDTHAANTNLGPVTGLAAHVHGARVTQLQPLGHVGRTGLAAVPGEADNPRTEFIATDEQPAGVVLQFPDKRLDRYVTLDEHPLHRRLGPGARFRGRSITRLLGHRLLAFLRFLRWCCLRLLRRSRSPRLFPPDERCFVVGDFRLVLLLQSVVDVLGHLLNIAVGWALGVPGHADRDREHERGFAPAAFGGNCVGGPDRRPECCQGRQRDVTAVAVHCRCRVLDVATECRREYLGGERHVIGNREVFLRCPLSDIRQTRHTPARTAKSHLFCVGDAEPSPHLSDDTFAAVTKRRRESRPAGHSLTGSETLSSSASSRDPVIHFAILGGFADCRQKPLDGFLGPARPTQPTAQRQGRVVPRSLRPVACDERSGSHPLASTHQFADADTGGLAGDVRNTALSPRMPLLWFRWVSRRRDNGLPTGGSQLKELLAVGRIFGGA